MRIDSHFERSGESRMEAGFRLRPFTAVFVLVLGLTVAGGLVATFVFVDTADEKLFRGVVSISAALLAGLALAIVVKREERAPFPLVARKALWLLLLVGYFAGAFLVLRLVASPFVPRLEAVRFAMGLVMLAQVPFYSWRLLRDRRMD